MTCLITKSIENLNVEIDFVYDKESSTGELQVEGDIDKDGYQAIILDRSIKFDTLEEIPQEKRKKRRRKGASNWV